MEKHVIHAILAGKHPRSLRPDFFMLPRLLSLGHALDVRAIRSML